MASARRGGCFAFRSSSTIEARGFRLRRDSANQPGPTAELDAFGRGPRGKRPRELVDRIGASRLCQTIEEREGEAHRSDIGEGVLPARPENDGCVDLL